MSLASLFAPLARLFGGADAGTDTRSPEEQARIDAECARLSLYQFKSCPFCVKVRRAFKRLDIAIEIRDIRMESRFKEELLREGGKGQVPCLRIEEEDGSVRWLYESYDIVKYLEKRFAATNA